jgi:four helix bundle protein
VGISRLDDLIAWQLARTFKLEVYRLLRDSSGALTDPKFQNQLRDAAASVSINIGEGFYRFGAREFRRYLTIALASLGEATLWLQDGVDRGYFVSDDCEPARTLAKRCRVATLRLRQSSEPKGPDGPQGPSALTSRTNRT